MNKLGNIFHAHQGNVADRWSSYLDRCVQIFEPLCDKSACLLEVGTQNGELSGGWARFFPWTQVIAGCDVNPPCGSLIYEDSRIITLCVDIGSDDTEHRIEAIPAKWDVVINNAFRNWASSCENALLH